MAYLFLCTVSDRAGLSFWNLERMGEILGLDSQTLEAALARLNDLDLIARQGRVVQVLPLPPAPPESGTPPDSRPTPKVTRAVAPVEAISPVDEVDLTADEISRQVPEARRRVARLGGLACSERVQRVARALALEARSKQACPGGEARG